jgi:hypothetical protein
LVIWLSGLSVVVLVAGALGVTFALRKRPGHRHLKMMGGSVTDLSEGFAMVRTLRLEITRLREENERLQEDRRALLNVLSRLGELLEQEGRRRTLSARP